jgi:tetratricopeptide (TPR) repeat protein
MAKNIFKDSHITSFIVFVVLIAGVFLYLKNYTSKDYLVEKYGVKAQAMLEKMDLTTATDEEVLAVIAAFEKAIAKSPLSGRAGKLHFNIARIYVLRQQYDQAVEEMRKVIRNFSRNGKLASEAHFQIGRIYEVQDKWPEAVKAYEEIYENYSLSQRGLYIPLYLAERFKMMGQNEQAAEYYEKALKHYEKLIIDLGNITQTAILVNYVALTYGSQELWDKAVEKWQELIATYKESPLVGPTLLTLGEVYATRIKDDVKAIESYNQVVERYPGTDYATQAGFRLLQLYFFRGDYTKAREWCLQIVDKQKDNQELASEATLLLARTYEKEGNWEEAEKIYDKVTQEFSTSLAALRVPIIKAKHYQEVEQIELANSIYSSAMLDYQRLIADNPDAPIAVDAQDLISLVYVNQENWNGLIEHLNALLAKVEGTPRYPQLLFLKGYITQTKLNDREAARALYEQFLAEYSDDHPLSATVRKQLAELDEQETAAQVSAEVNAEVKTEDTLLESILPIDNK